ncbi:MAG TPA: SDR family NAD(P)-dependent oxidoreductase [Terracidiphilus sp.]
MTAIQPEAEMDAAQPRFLSHRQPPFLSRRSKNAQAVIVGGAALAGAVALSAAALAIGIVAGVGKANSKRLRGKTVLITGSSRGLGLALAEEFAQRGARIVLTARDQDELDRARSALLERYGFGGPDQVMVVPADLRKQEDAAYLVHRVTEAWGQIDVLVNNAGIITVGPIENQTAQDFRDVMDTNFFSGVHCTLAVLPQMLHRKGGTIVNIASIGGKVAVPHLLPYTASKFAAVGFSEGLNAELRDKGVHVLTVCPGLMRTGSHVNALFSGDAQREYRWFSMGASTPIASTSARSAARKIVRAVVSRATEIAITPQAIAAARLGNLSPELTGAVMSMMNRLLPSPSEETARPVRGMDVRELEPMPAAKLGWSAARRYNEAG